MGYELDSLLKAYKMETPVVANAPLNFTEPDLGSKYNVGKTLGRVENQIKDMLPSFLFNRKPSAPPVEAQPAPPTPQSYELSRLAKAYGVNPMQNGFKPIAPAANPAPAVSAQPPSVTPPAVDYGVNDPGGVSSSYFSRGGAVRGYAPGGSVELANPTGLPSIMPNVIDDPTPQQPAQPMAAPQPAAAPAAQLGGNAAQPGLEALLSKYGPGPSVYADELRTARESAAGETKAFNELIQRALAEPASAPSKAELYFRLASAFGAPTKTGKFSETLSAAGRELADDAKLRREAERADRANKLQIAVTGQKAKMDSARDDLTTLRALAGEEMKDKRAVATKLIEQYIKSGEPESAAGKQAKDEGFKVGTPEYQKRVTEIGNMLVEKQMAQINAVLAGSQAALGNLNVAQARLKMQQDSAGKLTPAEVKLKTETEDKINGLSELKTALSRAYDLNANSFNGSLVDTAQRKALEAVGSNRQIVVNTNELENILNSNTITDANERMKGVLSDSDIKLVKSIQGVGAKSREERDRILRNAAQAVLRGEARMKKRLNEISSGLYRDVDTTAGE